MVPSWMKKRLAAHSQTDQSCDRPLSVSAGIPFVCRAVGIGTASRKKMTGCRGIIGPIPQPLVIRYSDVGTHSSIKEVFVNRFSEHFSEHFFLFPKTGKSPGESPENASSGRLGSCLVFSFQLCCRLSGRPLRRTVSPLSGRTFRSCTEEAAFHPGSSLFPSRQSGSTRPLTASFFFPAFVLCAAVPVYRLPGFVLAPVITVSVRHLRNPVRPFLFHLLLSFLIRHTNSLLWCHAVAWQYFVLCIVFRVSFFRFDLQFLCLTSRGTSGSAQSGCISALHSQDSSAHPPGC